MAAKGGGQWKVAYADFVTAMMAFFLVMWITAQDQKIKQAVARYFNNPMNFESVGLSAKPDKTGSALPLPSTGQVPLQDSVAMGHGRHSFSQPAPKSPQTKAVADWIYAKEDQLQRWLKEAERIYWLTAQMPEARLKRRSVRELAAERLGRLLQDDFADRVPSQLPGVYQDLMYMALSEVNWREIAEDLLAHWQRNSPPSR
ncbi:MAG: flagellar motor protein MotB [Gemmatales bacterium]|nr:flagellar motor protein MotB [Gemmatales bacterium]